MKNIAECLAHNLRRLRKERKMTQEVLAERAGLSLGTIQLIETRKRWPERESVASLAQALGVPETSLFVDPELRPSVKEAWEIITEELEPKFRKSERSPGRKKKP